MKRLEKLQCTVNLMSRRIRTLENALRVDRAALSADPHPLLAEELLEIKKGTSSPDVHNNLDDLEDSHDNDGVADSLGLLSMNEGEARFVGASGSEVGYPYPDDHMCPRLFIYLS